MVQKEFTNKLISLLDEFNINAGYIATVAVATNEITKWYNNMERNENIDEVRSDYVDDDGATVIDVWVHGKEDDLGFSVARVMPSGDVEWTDKNYEYCPKILEEIQSVLNSK